MTQLVYQNFIGIDIGKYEFVVACHGTKQTHTFENTSKGFERFMKAFESRLPDALVVLETTGGYELELLLYLNDNDVSIHRANTRQVKAFIRSLGHQAKTDALDALALARYGAERHEHLTCFKVNKEALALYELAQRRSDLKKMIVQEKNRYSAPRANAHIKRSCSVMLDALKREVAAIDDELRTLIEQDNSLKQKVELLQSIEGVGITTAINLLCFMPELGSLNQKQVASLAGLAPYAHDSGTYQGVRRIKGGRKEVRSALFMAAMAAARSSSKLRQFYDRLIANGKKPIVAITALMRKIIVIANARIKEAMLTQQCALT